MFRKLLRLANTPTVMVVAGIFLAASSAVELGEALMSFRDGIQGEHGAFIYGLMSTMKGLGELGEVEEGVLLAGESEKDVEKAREEAAGSDEA
ncbi:MAG: hypothetical protein HN396_06655 [Gemmatimonadales bacterium]|jgi:hypothetical protein|nr:hypothetical protein [Gemmatimonadales bacterium]MBT3499925.1 hypothetical protein [Gemmatimonadales bacterium]MBT3774280.1 hypothetical protein [Gemmatimonadales bacterium]MBT3957886.1 hypothetical protein [Gemmatimonadales bacterium]MBT4188806.1 hypothetical protein [Gemmatimonadales bacterium]